MRLAGVRRYGLKLSSGAVHRGPRLGEVYPSESGRKLRGAEDGCMVQRPDALPLVILQGCGTERHAILVALDLTIQ